MALPGGAAYATSYGASGAGGGTTAAVVAAGMAAGARWHSTAGSARASRNSARIVGCLQKSVQQAMRAE